MLPPSLSLCVFLGSKAFDDDSLKYTYRDAMVGCMVRIHRLVRSATDKYTKRTGNRHFVSPRDYLDFIRHFQKL